MYARVWVCQPMLSLPVSLLVLLRLEGQERLVFSPFSLCEVNGFLLTHSTGNAWQRIDEKASHSKHNEHRDSHNSEGKNRQRGENRSNDNQRDDIFDCKTKEAQGHFFAELWELGLVGIERITEADVFLQRVSLGRKGRRQVVAVGGVEVGRVVAHRSKYVWVAVKVKHFPLCLCQEVHRPCRKPRPPS